MIHLTIYRMIKRWEERMGEILKNLVLTKRQFLDSGNYLHLEIVPEVRESKPKYLLSIDNEENIFWGKILDPPELKNGKGILIRKEGNGIVIDTSINLEFDIIKNGRIRDTEIYYKEGKIGLGILPRLTYKFDISIPPNTLTTAFHVGDGSFGFSIGNGTSSGFLPQILGMGSDENDAGLYLLGKSGNDEESEIPLIVIDGRNNRNLPHESRPILGVTNGNYLNYNFIIDQYGRVGIGKKPDTFKLEVKGSIKADNFILGEYDMGELIKIIENQQKQINKLLEIAESLLPK